MTRSAGLAGLIAILLLLAVPGPALAQSTDCFAGTDRGFGGTGQGEEPPVPGTTARSTDRGFGGTGLREDRGFGGTGRTAGVFGTLTGFGSICVNGLHIGYDADTPVDRDGAPSDARSLRRGETLLVDAAWQDGRLEARRISVQPALTGPITAVDAARRRLEVMGEPVELPSGPPDDGGLRLDALVPGDRVSVHGLPGLGGGVVATRIERAAPGASPVVVGRVRASEGGGLAVGEVALAGTAAQPGAAVRVAGHWDADAGRLVGERVGPALAFAEGTRHVSVEARVVEREAASLETSFVRIDASRIAQDLGSLPRGARVWVDGWLDPGGVLSADRLAIEPLGGGLPEPNLGHGASLELPRPARAPARTTSAGDARTGPSGAEPGHGNESVEHREQEHDGAQAHEREDVEHETERAHEGEDVEHETEQAHEGEDVEHETEHARKGEDDWRFDPRDFLEPPEHIVRTEHDGHHSDDRRREHVRDVAEGDGGHGQEGGGYEAPEYEAPEYEVPEYETPEYEAPEYEAPEYEMPEYEAPEYEMPEYESPEIED